MRIIPLILLLALCGCTCWPPSAMPHYNNNDAIKKAGRPMDGTFEHRLHTKLYDAADKINKTK